MFDLFHSIHPHVMDGDRIPVLILALFITILVGIITGPVAANMNCLFWIVYDYFFGATGDRMDRVRREKSDLVFRGLLMSSVLLGFTLFLSFVIMSIDHYLLELFIICACLTSGSVWYVLLKLYFALDKKQALDDSYLALARSTRIDLNSTDEYGITRVALGYIGHSFDKNMVAPSLWYLIGGVPFLMIYATASFLAWRYGKSGFSKGFGKVPIEIEKLMGFVPSVFAGFIFSVAAAVTPSAKLKDAIVQWWSRKGKAPYEEGGAVLSALAWPLGVSLGGPVQDISGSTLAKMWIGPKDASAQISYKHLKRGLAISLMAHLMFLVILLAAYIYA